MCLTNTLNDFFSTPFFSNNNYIIIIKQINDIYNFFMNYKCIKIYIIINKIIIFEICKRL